MSGRDRENGLRNAKVDISMHGTSILIVSTALAVAIANSILHLYHHLPRVIHDLPREGTTGSEKSVHLLSEICDVETN